MAVQPRPDGPAGQVVDDHTRDDRKFHRATAHLYDDHLRPIFGVYLRATLWPILDGLARDAHGRDVLDLGAGTGGLTLELLRRGFRVTGLDHSPEMLGLATRKVVEAGFGHQTSLVIGDIRTLPFDDGSFDVVTCQGVLHHVEDLGEPLGELARVLRPGGLFYLAEPSAGSNKALTLWSLGRRLARKLRARATSVDNGSPEDPVAVPDHEEGALDVGQLLAILRRKSLPAATQYWNRYDGLDAFPSWLQHVAITTLSRPWRHRDGNLVMIVGSKPA
jgi:SAM-dependent methyltransferase